MEKKYSILVVDDEESIANLLYDYFRRDYNVYKASDGLEALEILRETEVQLVLTDQRMPNLEGMDLLAKLKEEKPDITRILMTGYTEIQVAVDAINVGEIHRYLTKPLDYDQLGAIIKDGLAQYEEVIRIRTMISSGKNAILEKIRDKVQKLKSVEVDKAELKNELQAARDIEARKQQELEQKLSRLENDKIAREQKLLTLEERASAMEAGKKKSEYEISMLKGQLERTEAELGGLRDEIESIRALAEESGKTRIALEEQKTRFELANKTAVAMQAENEKIKQDLDGARAEKTRIEKKLKQFQANWANAVS